MTYPCAEVRTMTAGPVGNAVVFGLHWTPPDDDRRAPGRPADLDAICELRGESGQILEVVGPDRLRSINGSVVHTGDSRNGASRWDDERIFVFLDAVPAPVHALVFVAASSGGEAFCDVPGASCHISDAASEERLVAVELTALGAVTEHVVGSLRRTRRGWELG